MKKAYVLINCDFGKEEDILDTIRSIKSVKEAHGTFGSYDIIAEVSAENAQELREDITWKIRKLPYIRATLTLIALEWQIHNRFISNEKILVILVNKKIQKLASQIFKVDPLIQHIGLIDLEGHILTDQSSDSSVPNEPDEDRVMFYYQVGLRRGRREHFNDVYGMTEHVHITREKMQQLILYLPMITVYITLDRSMTPDGVAHLAEKLRNLDSKLLNDAVKSTFYH